MPSAPQTKVSYADKVKEKAQSQFVENPHKTNAWEKTMTEIKQFWRNLNLVRKLMKLQSAIYTDVVGQAAAEINYEGMLIRISTTINQILDEFTEELERYAENTVREAEEPIESIDG